MSSVSEIKADLSAFMARAEKVEKALAKALTPSVKPSSGKRGLMKVKPDFDQDKHLTKRGAARHKRLWEDVAERRKRSLDPGLKGMTVVSNGKGGFALNADRSYKLEPLKDKAFDVYALRGPGSQLGRALIDLDETGNPEALKLLVEFAPVLMLYTKAFPGGYRSFISAADDGDGLPLDKNLSFGWLAPLDYALWTNRDSPLVPAKLQRDFSTFMTDNLYKEQLYRSIPRIWDGKTEARRALWKSAGCDTLGSRAILDVFEKAGLDIAPDKYGSRLQHPTEAAYCGYLYRSLQYGWAEDKACVARIGAMLDGAQGVVKSSKGELLLQPHGVPGRAQYLSGGKLEPLAEQGPGDLTYPREAMITYELSLRAGSKHHSERELGALCRTFVWCGMSEGPESDVCAAAVCGNGPRSLNGQHVVSIRDGAEIVKGSPVVAGRMEEKMPISALSRGENFIGARFTDAATIAEVRALNDKLPAGSRGNELGLFLCESKRL